MIFARACAAIFAVALLTAGGLPRAADASMIAAAVAAPDGDAREPAGLAMYVTRRGWHTDVGFAVGDLDPSLAFIARRFPQARYIFFGFGDRHYLMSRRKGTSSLVGALLPGPGVVLVTAIENSPAEAFGGEGLLAFDLTVPQSAAAQHFVRSSLQGAETDVAALAVGPYKGSAYYSAVPNYSALHTCNTWAAEALRSAGFRIHTRGVLFAGQTWDQARQVHAGAHASAVQVPALE